MIASVGALTENLFDYAGIYPPAALPLDQAVQNYLAYLKGKEAGLVAKFVCGVTRLEELGALLNQPKPIEITVVAPPSSDIEEWESNLAYAAKAMTDFQNRFESKATIEAFEIRIPSPVGLDDRLKDLQGFRDVEVFVELPWCPEQADLLYALSESEAFYAKARLGGAAADAFPNAEVVANFISNCTSLDLPYKLTAGLHHPFPTLDSATKGKMHGFINVGVAAGLCLLEDLSLAELREILECDSTEFKIDGDKLTVLEYDFDIEAAIEARELFLGIGSCSIEEPRQDLIQFGFMKEN